MTPYEAVRSIHETIDDLLWLLPDDVEDDDQQDIVGYMTYHQLYARLGDLHEEVRNAEKLLRTPATGAPSAAAPAEVLGTPSRRSHSPGRDPHSFEPPS